MKGIHGFGDEKTLAEVTATVYYGIYESHLISGISCGSRGSKSRVEIAFTRIGYFHLYVDLAATKCLKAIGRITNHWKSYARMKKALGSSYYQQLLTEEHLKKMKQRSGHIPR